jgi:chemotaxis protein MotB
MAPPAPPPGAGPQAPVIIIRKKRKGGGHGGHHGGAWKVAYADFVTAMMSFFLLLWLLNVTTDVQRKGIADYFAPASISKSESGAGGVMGGQTITESGAQMSYASPPTNQDVTVPTIGKGDEGDEDTKGENPDASGGKDPNSKTDGGSKADSNSAPATKEEAAMAAAMQSEEETFKKAESVLKEAIMNNPDLKQFANQIVIDRTPEGLRIQIIDRDKFSMFPSASAIPYERARDLIKLVGRVVAQLPNNISVTGHTDSTPFTAGSGRDNWTLSTERANVSRQYLVEAGVAETRVARVSGLSDRDPFVPNNTTDPSNRRISIVLLRQSLPPAEIKGDSKTP